MCCSVYTSLLFCVQMQDPVIIHEMSLNVLRRYLKRLLPMAAPTSSVSGSTAAADAKKYTYRELQDLVTGVCVHFGVNLREDGKCLSCVSRMCILLPQWTQELGDNEKMFQKHAQQIHDWDKTLSVNAEKIVELHENLDTVKADHNRQVFTKI